MAIQAMNETTGLSVVWSWQALGASRSGYCRARVDWQVRDANLIEPLNELVDAHPRWEG